MSTASTSAGEDQKMTKVSFSDASQVLQTPEDYLRGHLRMGASDSILSRNTTNASTALQRKQTKHSPGMERSVQVGTEVADMMVTIRVGPVTGPVSPPVYPGSGQYQEQVAEDSVREVVHRETQEGSPAETKDEEQMRLTWLISLHFLLPFLQEMSKMSGEDVNKENTDNQTGTDGVVAASLSSEQPPEIKEPEDSKEPPVSKGPAGSKEPLPGSKEPHDSKEPPGSKEPQDSKEPQINKEPQDSKEPLKVRNDNTKLECDTRTMSDSSRNVPSERFLPLSPHSIPVICRSAPYPVSSQASLLYEHGFSHSESELQSQTRKTDHDLIESQPVSGTKIEIPFLPVHKIPLPPNTKENSHSVIKKVCSNTIGPPELHEYYGPKVKQDIDYPKTNEDQDINVTGHVDRAPADSGINIKVVNYERQINHFATFAKSVSKKVCRGEKPKSSLNPTTHMSVDLMKDPASATGSGLDTAPLLKKSIKERLGMAHKTAIGRVDPSSRLSMASHGVSPSDSTSVCNESLDGIMIDGDKYVDWDVLDRPPAVKQKAAYPSKGEALDNHSRTVKIVKKQPSAALGRPPSPPDDKGSSRHKTGLAVKLGSRADSPDWVELGAQCDRQTSRTVTIVKKQPSAACGRAPSPGNMSSSASQRPVSGGRSEGRDQDGRKERKKSPGVGTSNQDSSRGSNKTSRPAKDGNIEFPPDSLARATAGLPTEPRSSMNRGNHQQVNKAPSSQRDRGRYHPYTESSQRQQNYKAERKDFFKVYRSHRDLNDLMQCLTHRNYLWNRPKQPVLRDIFSGEPPREPSRFAGYKFTRSKWKNQPTVIRDERWLEDVPYDRNDIADFEARRNRLQELDNLSQQLSRVTQESADNNLIRSSGSNRRPSFRTRRR